MTKPSWWHDEWPDIPEDVTPFRQIYVHFESTENMERFSKLIGQTVTRRTRTIWYPAAKPSKGKRKR